MSDNTFSTIIIGTGFGGQCAAMKLKKLGIEDFVMLERRDFMGGTWCQ
ncbi:MAG: cation diffusion facilitator CzcD-associated flavoprotein CzcO, partial [Arenicella sp.]